jgi:hypothetical protein
VLIRPGAHQIDDRIGQCSPRGQRLLSHFDVPRPANEDREHQLADMLLRHEGHRRRMHEVGDGRHVLGRGRRALEITAQDFSSGRQREYTARNLTDRRQPVVIVA